MISEAGLHLHGGFTVLSLDQFLSNGCAHLMEDLAGRR